MNTFRAIAKNAVIVLMLVTTPLAQAKAVFVCSMMNHAVLEQCCCGDARDQRTRAHDADATACCTVSLEIREVGIAANALPSDQGVKRLWDQSPDLATAPPAPAPIVAAFEHLVRPVPFDPVVDTPTRLYLLTARLRL